MENLREVNHLLIYYIGSTLLTIRPLAFSVDGTESSKAITRKRLFLHDCLYEDQSGDTTGSPISLQITISNNGQSRKQQSKRSNETTAARVMRG